MALNGIMAGGFANGFLQGFQTMGGELARQGTLAHEARMEERQARKDALDAEIARQKLALYQRESESMAGYRDTQTKLAQAGLPYAGDLEAEKLAGLRGERAYRNTANEGLGIENAIKQQTLPYAVSQQKSAAELAAEHATGARITNQYAPADYQAKIAGQQAVTAENIAQTQEIAPNAAASRAAKQANTEASQFKLQEARDMAEKQQAKQMLTAAMTRLNAGENPDGVWTPEVFAAWSKHSGIPQEAVINGNLTEATNTLKGFLQGQVRKEDPAMTQSIDLILGPKVKRNLGEPVTLPDGTQGIIQDKHIEGVYDVPQQVQAQLAQGYIQRGFSPADAQRRASQHLAVRLAVTVRGNDGKTYQYLAPLTRDGTTGSDDSVYFPGPEDMAGPAAGAKFIADAYNANPELFRRGFELADKNASALSGTDALSAGLKIRADSRAESKDQREAAKDKRETRATAYREAERLIDKQHSAVDPLTGIMSFQGDSGQKAADEKIAVSKVLKSNPRLSGAEAVAKARKILAKNRPPTPTAPGQLSPRAQSYIDQNL